MTRCYVAHAMTGRDSDDVLRESMVAYWALKSYGITALDPAIEEDIQPGRGTLAASRAELDEHWRRDKQMIRDAHVLLDLSGPAKSEGVAHEIGYARYFLHKPVVRVYPGLSEASIARFEDDIIVGNVEAAAALIASKWGNPWKRFVWKLGLLFRCRFKAAYYEAKEWVNVLI